MNPKLPLDGRIYMLTVGSVLTTNVSQINLCQLAFVQSYSQSQARLLFVTTLGMDNFDCTKMNVHFEKSQLVYSRGSFTSGSKHY